MSAVELVRPTLTLCIASMVVGCATPPPPLYMWEQFPRQQYEALLREGGASDSQIRALQMHAEKARANAAALPPGFRAHLGMLHLAAGNVSAAREAWLAEKSVFPESSPYIDSLLKRLDGKATPPSSASKENPA